MTATVALLATVSLALGAGVGAVVVPHADAWVGAATGNGCGGFDARAGAGAQAGERFSAAVAAQMEVFCAAFLDDEGGVDKDHDEHADCEEKDAERAGRDADRGRTSAVSASVSVGAGVRA